MHKEGKINLGKAKAVDSKAGVSRATYNTQGWFILSVLTLAAGTKHP